MVVAASAPSACHRLVLWFLGLDDREGRIDEFFRCFVHVSTTFAEMILYHVDRCARSFANRFNGGVGLFLDEAFRATTSWRTGTTHGTRRVLGIGHGKRTNEQTHARIRKETTIFSWCSMRFDIQLGSTQFGKTIDVLLEMDMSHHRSLKWP